jgi:hypothetical protein
MENQQLKDKNSGMSKCPRKEAIKALSRIIGKLQEEDHAIVLAVDANQTLAECRTSQGIKMHSIEWLRLEHDLQDPFINLTGNRPPSTTIFEGRDIDYVLTHGIDVKHIMTLHIDNPATSDHLGITIDIDTSFLFNATYSTLGNPPRRKLTLNNIGAKKTYTKYIINNIEEQHLLESTKALAEKARDENFNDSDEDLMNTIDDHLTNILLPGEQSCSKSTNHRNPWSPKLGSSGKLLSYWKKKWKMSKQKYFIWTRLETLAKVLNLSQDDHKNTDPKFIKTQLINARRQWKDTKKDSRDLRFQHLQARAEEHAKKMNTDAETALKAILKTEQTKQTYMQIRAITGHKSDKTPLTQIDIIDSDGQTVKVTNKEELEKAIIVRNQRHARQSLQTPFASIPELQDAVNPNLPTNNIEDILEGTYIDQHLSYDLPDVEKEWIKQLKKQVDSTINIQIDLQDFIRFFKSRKERTASSASGRHMGHYKVIAELAAQGITTPAEIIVALINISIYTSRPLKRWKRSSQIMIEKGKGRHIENLRIIQLCEADLNFALNMIWGYRLTRHAQHYNAFNKSQYALPGLTCNSAIWNKTLFCDLIRQTNSAGFMTDYDAKAAFDRVLHSMSIYNMPPDGTSYYIMPLHVSTITGNGVPSDNRIWRIIYVIQK